MCVHVDEYTGREPRSRRRPPPPNDHPTPPLPHPNPPIASRTYLLVEPVELLHKQVLEHRQVRRGAPEGVAARGQHHLHQLPQPVPQRLGLSRVVPGRHHVAAAIAAVGAGAVGGAVGPGGRRAVVGGGRGLGGVSGSRVVIDRAGHLGSMASRESIHRIDRSTHQSINQSIGPSYPLQASIYIARRIPAPSTAYSPVLAALHVRGSGAQLDLGHLALVGNNSHDPAAAHDDP